MLLYTEERRDILQQRAWVGMSRRYSKKGHASELLRENGNDKLAIKIAVGREYS